MRHQTLRPRSAINRAAAREAFEVGSDHDFDKVTATVGYAKVYGVITLRIVSF